MEKRNNFARLLSLTLCLIMLVGIMPVNAFAAKAMATTISSVGVTGIEEPVYGERPDTTGKVEHSGVYEIESIRWKQQYSDNADTLAALFTGLGFFLSGHINRL